MSARLRLVVWIFWFSPVTLLQAGELNMAVIDLPPYGCEVINTPSDCLHNAIAAGLTEHTPLTIHTLVVPYPRAIRMLEQGEVDTLIIIAHPRLDGLAERVADIYPLEFSIALAKPVSTSLE